MKSSIKYISGCIAILILLLTLGCSGDGSDDSSEIIEVSSITIFGSSITDGGSSQLSITIMPTNATNSSVSWTVNNSNVATISNSGLLTAVSNGAVTVRATAQDGSGVFGEQTFEISGVSDPVNGTVVETSQQILTAIASANPGETIYVRGGDYIFNSTIQISGNGSNNNLISLLAYSSDTERPRFNFSSMSENSSNRGVELSGDYWHIKGIDIYAAGDNGMHISGNNNTIEFCTFSENKDSGLQIDGGGSNNIILNCDSYYNAILL